MNQQLMNKELHNIVFLEGEKAALQADVAWKGGWYDEPPTTGLRAVGRVYAGWGLLRHVTGGKFTCNRDNHHSKIFSWSFGRDFFSRKMPIIY
jgi:homoserine O-acetyltransferase